MQIRVRSFDASVKHMIEAGRAARKANPVVGRSRNTPAPHRNVRVVQCHIPQDYSLAAHYAISEK